MAQKRNNWSYGTYKQLLALRLLFFVTMICCEYFNFLRAGRASFTEDLLFKIKYLTCCTNYAT